MHRFVLRGAVVAAVLAFAPAGTALAAGTETTTEHEHGVVVLSTPTVNPCTGEAGTLTATATNAKFHLTTHADGTSSATGTAEGKVTFTPLEAGEVFSGHFTEWFGEGHQQKNEVLHDTGTFVLTSAGGSHVVVHMTSHLSTNAAGEVKVESEVQEVHCG